MLTGPECIFEGSIDLLSGLEKSGSYWTGLTLTLIFYCTPDATSPVGKPGLGNLDLAALTAISYLFDYGGIDKQSDLKDQSIFHLYFPRYLSLPGSRVPGPRLQCPLDGIFSSLSDGPVLWLVMDRLFDYLSYWFSVLRLVCWFAGFDFRCQKTVGRGQRSH